MDFKTTASYKAVTKLMGKRRLILDGAMGTQIQKFKLKKCHYGSAVCKGNNDILNFTQPKIIEKIHTDYLHSGADILTTNTFCSNSVSQLDYGNPYNCDELNKRAVLIAKRAGLKYSFHNKRRIFIAGSLGPTNKTLSISMDTSKIASKDITFDKLSVSYGSQINVLLNSKVDILLLETVFDTLNAKAAILAYLKANVLRQRFHSFVISVTINDISGRTLSGQTLNGFWHSISHSNPLGVGLNCSLGAQNMKDYAIELSRIIGKPIWIYPNAGLPNEEGKYTQSADDFANEMKMLVGVASVLGGCCGSTPEHISRLKAFVNINKFKYNVDQSLDQNVLWLSGLEALKVNKGEFCKICEKANVSGSSKFRNMIISENYEGALDIIKQQVVNGAQVIDINMDDALIDSEHEISRIISLINSEPDLARLPIMIDSSNWKTLLNAMKFVQGRCMINSISLKDGDKLFIEKAQMIKMYGCIPIVIAFDETGQATTIEHRLKICRRASILLIKYAGFNCEELIFDLNTFAIFTGIPEHDNNAFELIKSIKLINGLFPQFNFILGVSNLSFSFRGNTKIRESLHCVFLKHAVVAGLNLGIVNVQNQINYPMLDNKIKQICETLILNIKQLTIEDILKTFDSSSNSLSIIQSLDVHPDSWRKWNVWPRITYAIINGIDKYIESDSLELASSIDAIQVIEGPLMEGMNIVGKLFSSGKMFLPQIIKAARVMKKAVLVITPLIKTKTTVKKNVIVLATVKGDVHDIGKNIVGIVLSCNNYKIIDLGIMVSANDIVQAAIKYKANAIGISGLISPSLDEMVQVAKLLNKSSMNIPLLIGGATTSKLHTATRICPEYTNGLVAYIPDASKAVDMISKLLKGPDTEFAKSLKAEYKLIADIHFRSKMKQNKLPYKIALQRKAKCKTRINPKVSFTGDRTSNTTDLNELALDIKFPNNVLAAKTSALKYKMFKIMSLERWIVIRRNIALFKAISRDNAIILLNSNNRPIATIPMLRQQLDNDICFSLTDFISPVSDHIGIYCCVIGIESMIIQQYFKDKGRLHCAAIFKSICDDLIEASSKRTYDDIRFNYWGYLNKHSGNTTEGERAGIRPGPGYPSCPDHRIKFILSKITSLDTKLGLLITKNYSLFPQTSVLSMVISNPYSVYFNINSIGKDQVIEYAKVSKISVKKVEKMLSSIINYVPEHMLK